MRPGGAVSRLASKSRPDMIAACPPRCGRNCKRSTRHLPLVLGALGLRFSDFDSAVGFPSRAIPLEYALRKSWQASHSLRNSVYNAPLNTVPANSEGQCPPTITVSWSPLYSNSAPMARSGKRPREFVVTQASSPRKQKRVRDSTASTEKTIIDYCTVEGGMRDMKQG